jgi:hypothetical protein
MIPPTSHDFGKPLFETKHESEGQYDPAYTWDVTTFGSYKPLLIL